MARAARKQAEETHGEISEEAETEQEHFERMSVPELNAMVDKLLAIRDVKVAAERSAKIKEIQEQMAMFNLTAADLEKRGAAKAKGDRSPAPAKYRDPVTGATSSGRGKISAWLAKYEAEGRSRDEFLIEKSQEGSLL